MRKRWRLAVVAGLTSLPLLLAACTAGQQNDTTTTNATASVANFSNIALPANLDPAIGFSSDAFEFIRNVYDGLTTYTPGTTDVKPALAESWTVSADQKTYAFKLRQGVTYHDGTAFDAAAAKTGLDRLKAIAQGPAGLMKDIASVTAADASTLTIVLSQPNVYFLGYLPKLPLVSPAAIDAHKTAADPWAKDWFATNEAGTGPYTLKTFTRNSSIALSAYDKYWEPWPAQAPKEVNLRMDPDVQTALQLLGQGKIDMMGALGPDDSKAAAAMSGVKLVKQTSYQVQSIYMNSTKGPLKDARVRKALALAFDYDAMKQYYGGQAQIPTGALPTLFSPGLDALPRKTRDVAQAKQLLAQAGHPNGGFTVTYVGIQGLSYEEFAGTLLTQSMKDIGVTVKVQLVPAAQLLEVIKNADVAPDLVFLNVSPLISDPTYFLRAFYVDNPQTGGYNASFYTDKALADRIAAVSAIADETARNKEVVAVDQQINNLDLAIYAAEPTLAQPVRDKWDVTYENLDYLYLVRFFYARDTSVK